MFAPQQRPASVATTTAPFTPHEHALFVEGVEVFCNNNGTAVGESAWRHIAAHVRTRSPEEIKAHAQYYLMSLQSRNPEITCVSRVPEKSREESLASEVPLGVRARATGFSLPSSDLDGVRSFARLGSRLRRGRGLPRGRRRRMRRLRTLSRRTRRATRTDGPKSPRCFRPSRPPTFNNGTRDSSGTSWRSNAAQSRGPRAIWPRLSRARAGRSRKFYRP